MVSNWLDPVGSGGLFAGDFFHVEEMETSVFCPFLWCWLLFLNFVLFMFRFGFFTFGVSITVA